MRPYLFNMLSDLKNFVNKNGIKIFWAFVAILISLVSFGSGYLIASKNSQPGIIIQNPAAASIQKAIIPALEEKVPVVEKTNAEAIKQQGKFVGSINSNKYHLPDCPSAKKILPQNQIWFDSEEEAQKAGYIKCGSCGK